MCQLMQSLQTTLGRGDTELLAKFRDLSGNAQALIDETHSVVCSDLWQERPQMPVCPATASLTRKPLGSAPRQVQWADSKSREIDSLQQFRISKVTVTTLASVLAFLEALTTVRLRSSRSRCSTRSRSRQHSAFRCRSSPHTTG